MTASKKLTGAAAKSSRQSKLSVVRPTDEQQPTQQQQEQQPVNTQPTATEQIPVTTFTTATLADMKAQRRAIDEQIKVAKATQPKVEKQPKPAKTLHDVVAQQESTVGIGHVLYIASRSLARVKMGQDVSAAVDEVAAREGEAAKGAIEYFQTGDYASMRNALIAWASVNMPLVVTKQHVQVSEGDTSGEQ